MMHALHWENMEFVPPALLRRAERLRALERWPKWKWHALPDGVPGASGWGREVRRVAANSIFSVLVRPLPDGADHAMVCALNGTPPPSWAEKQRIKNQLFGARWAVECFPPQRRLVDGADAYHLWVLPPGATWPYDLKEGGE